MSDIPHRIPLDDSRSDALHVQSFWQAAEIFIDGGELGALCRAKDWHTTALGPVETWSQPLKTAVNITLNSSFPTIILWGQALTQIYNDAYRLIMGVKHPTGLGQPSRECWPEVVELTEPLYQRALSGEVISMREALIPLAPYGHLEDYYLTFCYTPIRDEFGGVGGIFVTVFDVTPEVRARNERDRAFAEAQAERERLYEVFMQAPAAIAVLESSEHTFTVANPLYIDLIGGRSVVGKSIREAFPELVGQGIYELLDTVRATGVPYVAQDRRLTIDRYGNGGHDDLYIDFVYQPLKDTNGHTFGIMAHIVETTEQVLARQEVERKADELIQLTHALGQSNRELEQFAYIASHDLRAPLRGIANLATWIEEDIGTGISGDVQQHLDLLHGRVTRMESLINGILDYSRAGRLGDAEQIDTDALVRDVLDLQPPPENVRVDVQPDMPTVEAERIPLQQIFMNLIGNAVKYTRVARPDGIVQVGWEDSGDTYTFSITDNGPGIAPQFHDRIWGIFQTLEARDKVEGAGIGLAIVKKMIERRGGRVWVDSTLGNGATFAFTWHKHTSPK